MSSDPPSEVTKISSSGFSSPSDAVASPDGKTFYFTAIDDEHNPAIFSTPSTPEEGGTATVLAASDPLSMPMGLVLSCDGDTLFIGDTGGDEGAIFSLSTTGGTPAALSTVGIVRPSGLAMGPDCKTLYATGHTLEGAPALFALALDGSVPRTVYAGAPLVSPTGLHVDNDGVAWVMDHHAQGANGEGVLFAIPSDGSTATEVVSNLRMGTPGGVSLTAGGGTAVMPTRDEDGRAQLTSVSLATGEVEQLSTPDLTDPAGVRTARNATVMVVVDSEGGAIYRAE